MAQPKASSSDTSSSATTVPSQPTSPPASSPTPSPTSDQPREPVLPAAAAEPGRLGAQAFVRYYVDLLNYASLTGATDALETASQGCAGCDAYVALYQRVYDRGGGYKGMRWFVDSSSIYPASHGFYVLARLHSEPGSYAPHPGATPKKYGRERFQLRFQVDHKLGRWAMTDMLNAS